MRLGCAPGYLSGCALVSVATELGQALSLPRGGAQHKSCWRHVSGSVPFRTDTCCILLMWTVFLLLNYRVSLFSRVYICSPKASLMRCLSVYVSSLDGQVLFLVQGVNYKALKCVYVAGTTCT